MWTTWHTLSESEACECKKMRCFGGALLVSRFFFSRACCSQDKFDHCFRAVKTFSQRPFDSVYICFNLSISVELYGPRGRSSMDLTIDDN